MPKIFFSLLALPALLLAPVATGQFSLTRPENTIPTQVDTMYLKGLRFLQSTQTTKGNWPGQYGDEPGVVGFALMAFLAHGEDPNTGPYALPIKKCLDYILSKQNSSSGYIGNGMYTHGFATLALAESYGMVKDDRLGPALKKAVDLILNAQAQNPKGGWRYSPEGTDSDTSICGCQMVALFAAKNAGIGVPDEVFKKAQAFMDSCCNTNTGGYGYTSRSGERVTLTSIGVLVQSIGQLRDKPSYKKSVDFLKKNINYRESSYLFYFEYYMAQALFHADEALWNQWNSKNIKLLYASQMPDGSWPGTPGPAYATSLALLSLAVNYRFLPIYEK